MTVHLTLAPWGTLGQVPLVCEEARPSSYVHLNSWVMGQWVFQEKCRRCQSGLASLGWRRIWNGEDVALSRPAGVTVLWAKWKGTSPT